MSEEKPSGSDDLINAANNSFKELCETLESEQSKLQELETRRARLAQEMEILRRQLEDENKAFRATMAQAAALRKETETSDDNEEETSNKSTVSTKPSVSSKQKSVTLNVKKTEFSNTKSSEYDLQEDPTDEDEEDTLRIFAGAISTDTEEDEPTIAAYEEEDIEIASTDDEPEVTTEADTEAPSSVEAETEVPSSIEAETEEEF